MGSMKIESVLEKLKSAVEKTEKITTKKASLSVLECLLLEVKDNTLFVRATNLDIGIEVKVPVKVQETGRVAVPASVFSQYLSHLPDTGSVTLTHEDNTLVVSSENTTSEIKTQKSDEFPSIPSVEEGTSSTISSSDLTTGFRSVWYAASPSSMKPELSSVYMYSENNTLYFVATDSFRLAEKTIKNTGINSLSVLIPHQNVGEIIRVFSDIEDELTVSVGENQIAVENESVYVSSRLVDGTFPDYKNIIPDSNETQALVSTNDFMNTVRLSDIFSDKFNKLTITSDPNDDVVVFTTSNADIGENTTKIKADIEGEEVTAQFNHSYITDAFQSIDSSTTSISLSKNAPMVMHGKEDDTFQYLVMPMST